MIQFVFIITLVFISYFLMKNNYFKTYLPDNFDVNAIINTIDPKIYSKSDPKTQNKIIVKFKESEYDLTDFAKKHPGGKKIILENNGNNIEQLMTENDHSSHAYKLLEKYKIS